MAGGVGSRFWPVSRNARPKQFLDILGIGKTFLQMTYERFEKIIPADNILIVTSVQYSNLVREQLPQVKDDNILFEPYKRNTGPCVAYATYKLYSKNPDAVVVVAPSDHLIVGEDFFLDTISSVMDYAANNDDLFTIGVKPTAPNTNYGYIQANKAKDKIINQHTAYPVKTFTEKPDADLAKVFLETGEFFWNSGMFIWNLKTIKKELELCLPEVASLFAKGEGKYYTPEERYIIQRVYEESPAISIDYGLMEKTKKAWVFLANFGWSDVGTWGSLYDQSPDKDENGNVVRADNVLLEKVNDTLVQCENKDKLMVVRGLDNFMVIDTPDVLMVCPREDAVVKEILMDMTVKEKTKYL